MSNQRSSGLRIGVTGSEGLIGQVLCERLGRGGQMVRRLDKRLPTWSEGHGDIRDAACVDQFVAGCDGIVHLAAVSRVVWGQRDPVLCEVTNVGGTKNVLAAALRAPHKPFVIFASSREIYGEPDSLPVTEDAPMRPINIYGRSKAAAEELVRGARAEGLRTAVLRLSNVYGSTCDHADRVVPAFARAASLGEDLRLDGTEHTFDFTHVDDTALGIHKVLDLLARGERSLPPIHLLTGRPTTLGALAELAIAAGGGRSRARIAPSRDYDVARFVGNPDRAATLLGWKAERTIEDGVRELVQAFRRESAAAAAV